MSVDIKWNAEYERIGRCAKHADAVQGRKQRKKPRKKLRPKGNKY